MREQAGDEEVFGVIEAALGFDGVGMAEPPVGAGFEFAGICTEGEGVMGIAEV